MQVMRNVGAASLAHELGVQNAKRL